jgi:hypothetical protein
MDDDDDECGAADGQGKPKYFEEILCSVILSTANHT